MSFKLHFLHFHPDFFPDNLDEASELDDRFVTTSCGRISIHGERSHQDIATIKRRHQGCATMMTDYVW